MTKNIFITTYWVLAHLGWWLLMLGAAATVGDLFLRRRAFHSWLERLVFSLAAGLGIVSLLWFVLGVGGLLYPALLLVITLLIAGYGLSSRGVEFFRANPFRRASAWLRAEWQASRWGLASKLLTLALLLVYEVWLVWATLFPPTAWDSTMYHLPLAKEYLNAHRLTPHMGLLYPVVPALNHLLFAWGLALKDELLPPLLGHTFLMLTTGGLIAWGWRAQRSAAGLAAAALWMAHPLVLLMQGTAYVDMGVSGYAFLALYALYNARAAEGRSWWLLAMSLAGMAAGTKMSGLIILAGVAMGGAWAMLKGWLSPRALLQGWGLAALIVLPWYGFIAYHTGNPVWPMFLAPSQASWRHGTIDLETWGKTIGVPRTIWNFLSLPVQLVRQHERFFPEDYLGFFAAVALFPAAYLVALRDRAVRWWTGWALFFMTAWFASFQALRYLFPALPMMGLAICASGDWLLRRLVPASVLRRVLWGGVIACLAFTSLSFLKNLVWVKGGRPPITAAEREAWLGNMVGSYAGVQYLNEHAAPEDTVYLIGGTFLPYRFKPRLVKTDYPINADAAGTWLRWPRDVAWLEQLRRLNPTWIFIAHAGQRLSESAPFDTTGHNAYELVYADATAYVLRRAPVPASMIGDIVRLQQKDCDAKDAPGAQPVYEGRLDGITCQGAWGWAWRPDQPQCPLTLEIYDNGALFRTVLASARRDDLLAAGKGDGRHAFTFNWPARWADGQTHVISVKVAGAASELTNSPQTAACAPAGER